MEGLPVEMVAEVLGWVGARALLVSVPLVCQQWTQLCDRSSLWRLAFLRTWPPPLFHLQRPPCVSARPPAPTTSPSSGATARPPAGKKIKSNNNIAWKSLCVRRLQLERRFEPELGVAEVVEALRSALDVAEHRLFVEDSDGDEEDDDDGEPSSETDDDISNQSTKKLRDKEEEEEEEDWEKRTTPAVTNKRAASGLHRNQPNRKKAKVVTARPRVRTRLLDQARVAAVRNAAERVEEILEPLGHASYMRQETLRFLDALAKRCRRQASVGEGAEARENGAHHLFSLLCDHVLYSRVNVDLQSDGEECFHQVSVLVYSLTTGLPLRISFTHGVDASGCLSCGLIWERIEGDDFRGGNWVSYQHPGTPLSQDPELLNALVAYLFGEANVDLISHSDLQAFLRAALVAHPTITTFHRLWC